jgi:hypothetical protein
MGCGEAPGPQNRNPLRLRIGVGNGHVMTEDEVLDDIKAHCLALYRRHKGNRDAYEEAASALADSKMIPPDVKASFMKLFMDTYDLAMKEGA